MTPLAVALFTSPIDSIEGSRLFQLGPSDGRYRYLQIFSSGIDPSSNYAEATLVYIQQWVTESEGSVVNVEHCTEHATSDNSWPEASDTFQRSLDDTVENHLYG